MTEPKLNAAEQRLALRLIVNTPGGVGIGRREGGRRDSVRRGKLCRLGLARPGAPFKVEATDAGQALVASWDRPLCESGGKPPCRRIGRWTCRSCGQRYCEHHCGYKDTLESGMATCSRNACRKP